jgi:transposase
MSAAAVPVVETEVTEKARRRGFTAEYKKRILEEADRCAKPGELGALLRREGLYSSHLAAWRKARRERGELTGLEPQKRGPKNRAKDDRDAKILELERRNARLTADLERARAVLEIQKKVAQLLGVTLPTPSEES